MKPDLLRIADVLDRAAELVADEANKSTGPTETYLLIVARQIESTAREHVLRHQLDTQTEEPPA